VNYFGAVAALEGLRPLLEKSAQPRAVAVLSNVISIYPGAPDDLVELCLAGDEAAAAARVDEIPAVAVGYLASKLALARWVRRNATTDAWAGRGILLNAVVPGLTNTTLVTSSLEAFKVDPSFLPLRCGSILYADGGTDAQIRADDWPVPLA
jgi:NAD(P)-dependent dehydrogenase (short-subunit alcohol dehydrogenase family)